MIIDCDRIDFFYPSTGAMSTIKRELHLKKFVKTKISMHIDNYEKDIAVLEKFELRDIEYLGKYLEAFVSGHFTPENASFAIRRLPVANGNMRNLNAADLVQLNVDVHLIKSYNLRLLAQYLKIKADATAFIVHINKTYQLTNDQHDCINMNSAVNHLQRPFAITFTSMRIFADQMIKCLEIRSASD